MRAGIQKPCISHTQWDPECANCYVMPMKILQSPREQFAKVDSIVRAIKYKPGYALEVVVPQMFSNYSWGMDCEFHLNVSVDDATKAASGEDKAHSDRTVHSRANRFTA